MKPAIGLIIAGLVLSGCSETKFADMLDAGKSAPDETQVRTGQALTMPPDMRLAQPGPVTEDGNLSRPAAAQQVAAAPSMTSVPNDTMVASEEPVATGTAQSTLTPEHVRVKQSKDFWASEMQPEPGTKAEAEANRKKSFWSDNTDNLFATKGKHNPFWDPDPNAATKKPITKDEALAKFGISKTKPDGTPKTTNEIDAELKAAVLAEKRKSNPDYGTINNLGNIFTDG